MITEQGDIYNTGDIAPCPHCGKEFIFYIWSFGSDWYGCRPCRNELDKGNPLLYIDDPASGEEICQEEGGQAGADGL